MPCAAADLRREAPVGWKRGNEEMNKLTTRIVVAALTFLLGITAASGWLIRRQSQEVQLNIPHAFWEPIFFRGINSVAKLSGQADLRKTNLPEGDLEVRMWWGFGLSPLEGITLRRAAGHWSALHVKADNYYEPTKTERQELRPPKSGWEACWLRLVDAGMLRLPDSSQVNCRPGGTDGLSFVVETHTHQTYRTYMYANPMWDECDEAQRMVEITEIFHREFEWKD